MIGIYFLTCKDEKPNNKNGVTKNGTNSAPIAKNGKTGSVVNSPAEPSNPDDIMNILHKDDAVFEKINKFEKCFSKFFYVLYHTINGLKAKVKTNSKLYDLFTVDIPFEHFNNIAEELDMRTFIQIATMLTYNSKYNNLIGINPQKIEEILTSIQEDENNVYIINPETQERTNIITFKKNTIILHDIFKYNFENNTIYISNPTIYGIIKKIVSEKVVLFGKNNSAYKDSQNTITIDLNKIDSLIINIENQYLPKLIIDIIKQNMKSDAKLSKYNTLYKLDSLDILTDIHRFIIQSENPEVSEEKIQEELLRGISSYILIAIGLLESTETAKQIIFTKI